MINITAKLLVVFLLFGSFASVQTTTAALPAFPGAEGAGAVAVGGRGGVVCKVTNLSDSGPGSLRHCVEDVTGPRTVIFDVGGTIELETHLRFRDPYITVAGQTAPGGGIQLRAAPGNTRGLLTINTREVIVRYLRLRKGYVGSKDSPVNITDTDGQLVENVIFDHVSLYWTENQNWTVYGRRWNTSPRNITLQNSILAEPMSGRVQVHIAAADSNAALNMIGNDMHNNLLANSQHRNPLYRAASGRFVNNIVYHATSWWSRFGPGSHIDIINNKFKRGPEAPGSRAQQEIHFIEWHPEMNSADEHISTRPVSAYVAGNWGEVSGMRSDTDNWPYTRIVPGGEGINANAAPGGVTPISWRRFEPLPRVPTPITVRHVDELEEHLLPIVGASKRLDCEGKWVPNRDAADARVIHEYRSIGGVVGPAHEDDVGGFPQIDGGDACVDSSGDGIPDSWVLSNGLDPADRSLGASIHESGYTFLELYLNGMMLEVAPALPAAPASVTVN